MTKRYSDPTGGVAGAFMSILTQKHRCIDAALLIAVSAVFVATMAFSAIALCAAAVLNKSISVYRNHFPR
jgi:hypothetical protein